MSVTDIKWRGPRPLASGDILRGRDRDLNNLKGKAKNFQVLEITAPSGFGKSSFIAAGLIPTLRLGGSPIRPNSEHWSWSAVLKAYDHDAADKIDPERLYRHCLGWPIKDERSLKDRFDELRLTGPPVVVLDQFEELIRYRLQLGAAMLSFIGQTAEDCRVTHVIAARSEYRDQFRFVEEACDSFFHWSLPEIDSESAVESIIEAPVLAAEMTIEREATELLRSWWTLARQDSKTESKETVVRNVDIGLLHLQGVLWLFKGWLERNVSGDTTAITLGNVKHFAEDYVGGADIRHGPRLYRRALVEYIRESCATIHLADNATPDWSPAHGDGRDSWSNGPRLMMARSAHLFSVLGYKVAQSRSGMFQTVLSEDLQPDIARAVAEAAAAASSEAWLSEVAGQIAAQYGGRMSGTGVARGWTSKQVLQELLAAGVQAWSAVSGDANILRQFTHEDDAVYELVHDGMGMALQEWAREELLEPRSIIGVITPRNGKSLKARMEPDTFDDADQVGVPHYWDGAVTLHEADGARSVEIRGFGWDASEITSDMADVTLEGWTLTGALFLKSTLKNVVFRGCDIKGAAFRFVKMTNVRFEECNLNGAAIRDCVMSGVEFIHGGDDGGVSELSSLDLLSFDSCEATGDGVALRSLRGTIGIVHLKVTGGPWSIEGTGVQHVALHANGEADFNIGEGSYAHITVEPPDLPVVVDPRAHIDQSRLVESRESSG